MANQIARMESGYIPEPNSGCWLWVGFVGASGYPIFRLDDRRRMSAHRASWTIFRGEVPEHLVVCHKCDTRSCVNPDHLFLGTHSENMWDASRKGRLNWKPGAPPRKLPVGEAHRRSKLTEKDVLFIRNSRCSSYGLARQFGVSDTQISRIRRQQSWGHLS